MHGPWLMRAAGHVLRWIGVAVVGVVAVLLIGFGLLQTGAGQDWLAQSIAQAVSRPGFAVSIKGLRGFVPFDVRVARIGVADAQGTYLTLRRTSFEIAPAALLSGRVHIRSLNIAEIDMARSSGSSRPLADYLRVPHLPVAIVLDHLSIGRLALAPPVLGEAFVATVAARAAIAGGSERISLDLHRTDGFSGNVVLRMALTGTRPVLSLRLKANEPTGVLLDRLLGRTDRLPLALSLDGRAPVADWHGRLTVSAGVRAHLGATIRLAVGSKTALGLAGTAAVASLLPADLASVVGDRATFSLQADFGERIVVNRLMIRVAAGTVAGDSTFGGPAWAIAAHLRTDVPNLALLSGIVGAPLRGSATLQVTATGSQKRPVVQADLSTERIDVSGSGAEHVEAHVRATPNGSLDDATTRIAVAAEGRIGGLVVPKADALTQRLGSTIDWSFVAAADRYARTVEVSRFSAQSSGGLGLTGSGHLATSGRTVAGAADFSGTAVGMRTGIAAADALLGSKAAFAGALRRNEAGAVALDEFALNGAAAKLSGTAHFDPGSHRLSAALTLDIPQLRPLSRALGSDLAGTVSARVNAEGPIDRLGLDAAIDGNSIAAKGAKLEHLQVSARVADLSQPKAVIDGAFRAMGLDGRLGVTAEPLGSSGLALTDLRLTAADSTIAGNLRVALAGGLVQGSLTGRFPDLGRWSGLAGRPLGGSLDLTAGLAAQGAGQRLDLSVNGTRLALGSGSSRIEVGRLALTARLADIRRAPSGTGRLSLSAARLGAVDLATATANFSSPRPGHFAFDTNAQGRPLSVMFAGEGGVVAGGGDLRLTRLNGTLGSERLLLEQPLSLSRRGADLTLSGLALRFGAGRITGSAAVKGQALSATLNVAALPVATAARLLGYRDAHGRLSLTASLRGTLRAPQGHVALDASGLSLAVSPHAQAPRLGVTIEGDWNGRAVGLQGRVTGLAGDRISFTGSLPLLLTPSPLGLFVPRQGVLALRVQGGGDVGHLADLLPLGEDRLSGRFTADVAIGGTVAAPAARGELRLTGARYANFASGAVLTDLEADLVGDRDRFRLASLSAGDGAGGSLKAKGSLVLGGASGPASDLSATIANFRIAARDEVAATASGTVSVTGPLTALKVAAPLTVDRAEIKLPTSLPPSVVVLKVTEINGTKGNQLSPPPAAASTMAAALDITLRMPGQILVRGHGLDSDWHGRLRITGTSAAPQIAGVLVASRGGVDLLGKSFRLTRGVITFDGSARLDPALDIVAEASAADITAQVIITGYASAPKITLSSTPPVPQDEILSRILFNQGVGQITAGQGLQLAQAAATLAGGGPGVLDRLRGKLGLDWLGFGQGPAGAASPILNPSVTTPTAASTAAFSAGKYIAPGVSVGVTQGVSPPTSKVTVEIDVGHHVTVDTEAGQNSGTGVGLSYRYDY